MRRPHPRAWPPAAAPGRRGGPTEHGPGIALRALLVGAALRMRRDDAWHLALAAGHHDIGKCVVPEHVLGLPRPLVPAERRLVQSHSMAGYWLLRASPSPSLRRIAGVVAAHHERFDGSGYPFGLRGADIPYGARVLAVLDVFDALVTSRPYKAAWPRERALAEIVAGSGSHFDPQIVHTLLRPAGFATAVQRSAPSNVWMTQALQQALTGASGPVPEAPGARGGTRCSTAARTRQPTSPGAAR